MTTTVITHPQLVAALVKPAQDIIGTLSIFTMDCLHAAVGISGEAGELLEAILFPPECGIDRVNVREELGDLYFYIEQLVQRTGIVMDMDAIYRIAGEAELTPDRALFYASAVSVAGSQVLDTVKKAAIYNKALDMELLTNQLSTAMLGAITVGFMFNVDRPSALAANIAKLAKRYESLSYSDQAAQDRADKVQPQEGTIPERKFFRGDVPDHLSNILAPGENVGSVSVPHIPRTSDMQDQVDAERGA